VEGGPAHDEVVHQGHAQGVARLPLSDSEVNRTESQISPRFHPKSGRL